MNKGLIALILILGAVSIACGGGNENSEGKGTLERIFSSWSILEETIDQTEAQHQEWLAPSYAQQTREAEAAQTPDFDVPVAPTPPLGDPQTLDHPDRPIFTNKDGTGP